MTTEEQLDFLKRTEQITRVANQAAHRAQEENRRLGIPNVFSRNGILYFELPDGTITTERPEVLSRGADDKKDK